MNTEPLKCETCGGVAVGVCCVPGVPYSAAYCRDCLEANAHPWKILLANTACLGGWANAADWWQQMVKDTCKRLNKTLEEFHKDLAVEEAVWREA